MPIYVLEKKDNINKIFSKLAKKDPKQLKIIYKRLKQVLKDPYSFKPLRSDMKDYREIHIDSHFVLIYSIDEQKKTVVLKDYNHHENIFT